MSEDWDLFAVVRSCSSSASSANTNSKDSNFKQQDSPPLPLFTHIDEDKDKDKDKDIETSSCNELQDSFKPFLPVTTTWSSPPLVVSSAPCVLMKQEQELLESQDQLKPSSGVRVFPASTSISSSSSVFVFRGQRDQLLQQQPLRSRKRKNQQKRNICHVTQENLSSDMWAWRKYGQKPIKGSPYPRNYYRCSSSKGCLARKQVERSNLDPNIFIVTYTGDHTHPRPTHRNSLAGSTRNKSLPVNPNPNPESSGQNVSDSNTVKEEIHLSPTTPLTENDDVQETNGDEEVNMEDEELDEVEEDDEDDDVDDLLIPNLAVRDRDDLFFSGDFPTWSTGSAGDGGG